MVGANGFLCTSAHSRRARQQSSGPKMGCDWSSLWALKTARSALSKWLGARLRDLRHDRRNSAERQQRQQEGAANPRSASSGGWHASSGFSYGALLVWLVLMLGCAVVWSVPRWLWLGYAGLSIVTFLTYWQDKWAAQKGNWRTPEKTLQMLALAGGWPGAVLAQQWLRHKSSKTSFQLQFWCMVLLNVAGVLWLLSPYGRHLLG